MSGVRKIVTILNAVPSPVAAWFRSDAFIALMIRPLANRLLPAGRTPIVVRSGPGKDLRFEIDPRNEKYYWTGQHEVHVQKAIVEILKPGMSFWDVGSHIGFFSLLGARAVGDSGHVHAFEPMPENRERLLTSIRMNGIRNITVHDVALAAESGRAILHAHRSSLMWTLVEERGEQVGISVNRLTLDEAGRSIPLPDLIKVDAEGAEVDVLRGGMRLLSTRRPALVVEFSDDTLLEEARALVPFYAFTHLAQRHWLLK